MDPVEKLFLRARQAHKAALIGAERMVFAITDHDDEYASLTASELTGAAEKLEEAARILRGNIAVFIHETQPPTTHD